ncbi:PqqD family protein [Chloroflexota bacterium]
MPENKNGNTRVYTKNSNIVTREVAGEMVLVPILKGVSDLAEIYTMDKVGARIWELIDGVVTVEQITNIITTQYRVTQEQAEADILEFLAELEEVNAIYAMTREKENLPNGK